MAARRSLHDKLLRVKMLLLDVDGVMTDGGLYYSAEGVEMKRFHAHDGFGAVRAQEHGLRLGIISGRTTPIVDARAKVLQIADVYQGTMDKVTPMRELQKKYGLQDEEFAFIGDELFDIPLLSLVGFSAGPQNARPEVKEVVDYVTKARGGDGAVREVIDLIMAHQSHSRRGNMHRNS